ncbi:MAG: FAD-dependent oxidoreductase [Gammaproteobacteria bacterium]|jgi:NADPH-dependent glutamate synthase beta subunit-like oxidoreductase
MKISDAEYQFSITATPDLADDTADIHYVPAPCQVACPIGTDAPSYIAYIWEGRNEEALEAITATNPFSAICGRVCDAPCEPACRRADSDGAIAIRNLKRYVLESLGPGFALPPVAVSQEKTVAIVGAGPAGLTAAHDLAEAGYEVHVHEATDKLGGMMFWGIPRFRLPESAVQQDIDRMMAHCPGIKVHLNSALGRDVSLDELKGKHDAVLLSIGAFVGKPMGVPGEAEPFVRDGVGFLYEVNAGARPTLPETVLVIGGGDVAMDACRVARRLPGVRNVKVVYRRDYDAMPARREELHGAMEEGIEVIYNTQPVGVVDGALRCVRTELGEPDEDGRRRPVNVEGSEHDIECGLVIAAVGQKTECGELDELGLMDKDRVRTRYEGMTTEDPKVFAAGDGAFGGSTIVEAMYQGHRAAYYVKAFLQGNERPLPYRTPYRTRRVAICNDPAWELNPRVEQQFHGLGQVPIEFPEIESTYTAEEAKFEAARCFRCDAETGSADYTVSSRESIFAMSRVTPNQFEIEASILQGRLKNRDNPFAEDHQATLDDLVFLPANLSRLVIDPYREDCKTLTDLGAIQSLRLEIPFIVTGLDDAPAEIRASYAGAVTQHGAACLGRRPPGNGASWIQFADETADASADAVVFGASAAILAGRVERGRDDQPVGLVVNHQNLSQAIPFALEQELDFLVLDAGDGLPEIGAELGGAPDLSILNHAVGQLRAMNREEDIDLVYFGGLRTGTDSAKMLALGANAVIIGAAAAIALGADITGGKPVYDADLAQAERDERCFNLLQAFNAEAAMMARCTGKTNVHNLEPEDLRAITLAVSRAAGVPMSGSLNQH